MKCVKFPESRLGTYLSILWILSGLPPSFPSMETGCLGARSTLVDVGSSHYWDTGVHLNLLTGFTHSPGQVMQVESKRAAVVSNLLVVFLLSSNPKDIDNRPPLSWQGQSRDFQIRNEGSKYLHYDTEMQQIWQKVLWNTSFSVSYPKSFRCFYAPHARCWALVASLSSVSPREATWRSELPQFTAPNIKLFNDRSTGLHSKSNSEFSQGNSLNSSSNCVTHNVTSSSTSSGGGSSFSKEDGGSSSVAWWTPGSQQRHEEAKPQSTVVTEHGSPAY